MTNERHEKALEAAMVASFGEGSTAVTDPQRQILLAATTKTIAAYLQAIDAVIVPKEPDDAMASGGIRVSAIASLGAVRKIYRAMLSKAPNHFTNGE